MNTICFVLYFVLMLAWCYLLISGSGRFNHFIEPLSNKKYLLKSLLPIGFRILEIMNYGYQSLADKKRLMECKVIYGERFGEYYLRVNMAEKVTYVSLCIVFTPILGPMFGNPVWCLFGLFAAFVLCRYADSKITDIISKREDEITRDFADMVSKMALLINAGMITREAWEQISDTGGGTLYEEMRTTTIDMRNGMSEIDAYIAFGTRCNVQFVKKFISMLAQNLSKGNKEIVEFLKKESIVCWEEKKHLVRRQGEAAANKLMIPLGMILIGIFVMILVPIVSNLNI